jgi:hypothetical protein
MIGVPIPVEYPYAAAYPYPHYPVYSFHPPPPGAILVPAAAPAVSSVRTGQEDASEADTSADAPNTEADAPATAPVPVLPSAAFAGVPDALQATMRAMHGYYGAPPAVAVPERTASIAELPGTPVPPTPIDAAASVEGAQA